MIDGILIKNICYGINFYFLLPLLFVCFIIYFVMKMKEISLEGESPK